MKEMRWFRRVCCFKILNYQAPAYLYSLLPSPYRHYKKRNYSKMRHIVWTEQNLLVILLLPQKIRKWTKLDTSTCQAPSYSVLRKALLHFIWPTANSTFGNNDVSGLKLLTNLRVGVSHLREHKLKHNFPDTLNPLFPCSLEAEYSYHFFIRCQKNFYQKNVLSDVPNAINSEFLKLSENEVLRVIIWW